MPQNPYVDSIQLKDRPIFDLSGGMVSNYNYTLKKANQVDLILNGDVLTRGAINKRKGRIKYTGIPFTGNPTVNTLYPYQNISGADTILGGGGGRLSRATIAGDVPLRTGLDPNRYLLSTQADNWRFFVNGVDIPFMTNSTAPGTYRVGIDQVTLAQFLAIAAAPAAGGNATVGGAGHRVSFRYRSSITGARSMPYIVGTVIQSPAPVVFVPGTQTYQFTIGAAAVSTDTQVNFIDFFAQELGAAQDAPYYFIGTAPNAAGVFAFGANVSDLENIQRERLDSDDAVPVNGTRDVEYWQGRLLTIVDDYHVRYSKQRIDQNGFTNLITSFPADNELEVGFGDGDPLQKVVVAFSYVFAFKKRSVWILTGQYDSSEFSFKRLKTNATNIGLLNPRAWAQAGDKFYFVSDDLKFYSFGITDFSTEQLRVSSPPISDPVADLFSTFSVGYRENVVVVNNTWGQYTQIWIAFSNGASGFQASQNYNSFIYDYGTNAWSIHTGIEIAASCLARDAAGDYRLYTSDYYGFVWVQGLTDGDGAFINGTSSGSNYNVFTIGPVVGGPFVIGEQITGSSSHASGTISFVGAGFLNVVATDGPFAIGETITGGTSGATATITSTTGILNDATAAFAANLIGTFASLIEGPGADQVRRVTAINSPTQIVVTPAWNTIPTNLTVYTIGGIDFQVWSRFDWLDDERSPTTDKQGWFIDFDVETGRVPTNYPASGPEPSPPIIDYGFDVLVAINRDYRTMQLNLVGLIIRGAVWSSGPLDPFGGIWGFDVWAGLTKQYDTAGFDLLFKTIQHRIINKFAAQFIKVNGWTYYYQQLENIRRL